MTDVSGLLVLERWMAEALRSMEPAARKRLFTRIGRQLRARTRKRMTAQVGPDGERWAPRVRDKAGQVRKTAKMMVGLRADRRLLATGKPDGAEVGWKGTAARIAEVHHNGAFDYVEEGSSVRIRYPQRRLIGLSADDVDYVRQALLDHIAAAFSNRA